MFFVEKNKKRTSISRRPKQKSLFFVHLAPFVGTYSIIKRNKLCTKFVIKCEKYLILENCN